MGGNVIGRGWTIVVTPVAALMLSSAPATAQQITDFLGSDIPFDLPRGEAVTVQDRTHPELEPLGIRAGSMLLFTALTAGVGFTSNVYGASTRAVADGFATEAPQVALISQWSRNFLEITGSGDFKQFFTQTARSHSGYSVGTDGRIDLGTGDYIVGIVHHQRGYVEQYSGAFPENAADALGYNLTDATIRGTVQFNQLKIIASAKIIDLAFSNAYSLTGQLLNEQYQNHTEYRSAGRLEYAFNPDIAAFGEASYIRSDYHVAVPGQPLRDNNATRFLAGGNFDLGKLIRGTIGIGYENHRYDLSFYRPIKGIAFDAQLQWLPTELTTVNFNATRKVEDAIDANSPGYFASLAQLRIDHELLRYVLLFAETTYERDKFVAIDRRDNEYLVHAGVTYSLGRRFKLKPSMWYISRNSVGAQAGPSFNEVRGTMEVFTQF